MIDTASSSAVQPQFYRFQDALEKFLARVYKLLLEILKDAAQSENKNAQYKTGQDCYKRE